MDEVETRFFGIRTMSCACAPGLYPHRYGDVVGGAPGTTWHGHMAMRREGFANPREQITFCMPHLIFRDRQGVSRQTQSLASRPHCHTLYNTRRLQSCCVRVVHALVLRVSHPIFEGHMHFTSSHCRGSGRQYGWPMSIPICTLVHCLIETATIYTQANIYQFTVLTSGGTG